MLLAVAFFITVAWLAREVQGMRERAGLEQVLAQMRVSHHNVREGVRRMAEDFFVMQHLLAERAVIAESDMVKGRRRLIDAPRRRAQEKKAFTQNMEAPQVRLMVEDREGNMH